MDNRYIVWDEQPPEIRQHILCFFAPSTMNACKLVSKAINLDIKINAHCKSMELSVNRLPKAWQERVIYQNYPLRLAMQLSHDAKLTFSLAAKRLLKIPHIQQLTPDKQKLVFTLTGLSTLAKGLIIPEEIALLPSASHYQLLLSRSGLLALQNRKIRMTSNLNLCVSDLYELIKNLELNATKSTAHRYGCT